MLASLKIHSSRFTSARAQAYAMKRIESVLASLLVAVAAGGGSGKVH